MIDLLLAVALVGAKPAPVVQPPAQPLSEAAHAIQAGRLDQARLMIGNAVKAGVRGPEVDRLLADLPAHLAFVGHGAGIEAHVPTANRSC